jgi:hypothetical protein
VSCKTSASWIGKNEIAKEGWAGEVRWRFIECETGDERVEPWVADNPCGDEVVTDLPTSVEIGDLIEFLSGLRLISLCCVIVELVEDISIGALVAVPFYRHLTSCLYLALSRSSDPTLLSLLTQEAFLKP